MISEQQAAALAQDYVVANLTKPQRAWDAEAKATVEFPARPLKVKAVRPAPFGYTVTYNASPPSLGGQRPIHVGADGSDVRVATLRETWEADPAHEARQGEASRHGGGGASLGQPLGKAITPALLRERDVLTSGGP